MNKNRLKPYDLHPFFNKNGLNGVKSGNLDSSIFERQPLFILKKERENKVFFLGGVGCLAVALRVITKALHTDGSL